MHYTSDVDINEKFSYLYISWIRSDVDASNVFFRSAIDEVLRGNVVGVIFNARFAMPVLGYMRRYSSIQILNKKVVMFRHNQ